MTPSWPLVAGVLRPDLQVNDPSHDTKAFLVAQYNIFFVLICAFVDLLPGPALGVSCLHAGSIFKLLLQKLNFRLIWHIHLHPWLSNLFCKRPGGKHFTLCGPIAKVPQLGPDHVRASTDNNALAVFQ